MAATLDRASTTWDSGLSLAGGLGAKSPPRQNGIPIRCHERGLAQEDEEVITSMMVGPSNTRTRYKEVGVERRRRRVVWWRCLVRVGDEMPFRLDGELHGVVPQLNVEEVRAKAVPATLSTMTWR
jgi:hypothetical protein